MLQITSKESYFFAQLFSGIVNVIIIIAPACNVRYVVHGAICIDSFHISAYDVSEKLKVTVDLRKSSIKLKHTMR